MSDAIIVAIISGIVTLAGTVLTVIVTSRKSQAKIETSQAVMEHEITELTREVREHNDFARRVPVIEEQIKVINHRVDDLERKKGA